MLPKLHPDWWLILKRAWSVRLMLFAALCDFIAAVLHYWIDNGTATLLIVALAALANVGAFVARFCLQANLPGDA